jgi:Abortive infection alpha
MSEKTEAVKESAKATQEVAKTTGKAIDAAREFGGFISRYISGSLEQGMGIFEDKLKYMRWERQMRLMRRASAYMASIGVDTPTKPIPLKLAVPLLEAASLEDDDYLQDLWAKLLVNSSIEGSPIDLNRSYIDILERLSHLEAKILSVIYAQPEIKVRNRSILTGNLPDSVEVEDENSKEEPMQPSEEVIFALANLERLGCISLPTSWGGGQIFSTIYPAVLGRKLVEACTLKSKQ